MAVVTINSSNGGVRILSDEDSDKIITLGTLEVFKELADVAYKKQVEEEIGTLKTELNNEIANVQLKIEIETNRDILSSTGKENVLYFIPLEDPTTDNKYEEYVYYNSAWELIGAVDTTDFENYVKTSTTVNGHALTGNITLTASDVGATTDENVASQLSAYVTKTTTVNGKALSSNITLAASDVGALSEITCTSSGSGNVVTAISLSSAGDGIVYTLGPIDTAITGDQVYTALSEADYFATDDDIKSLF